MCLLVFIRDFCLCEFFLALTKTLWIFYVEIPPSTQSQKTDIDNTNTSISVVVVCVFCTQTQRERESMYECVLSNHRTNLSRNILRLRTNRFLRQHEFVVVVVIVVVYGKRIIDVYDRDGSVCREES